MRMFNIGDSILVRTNEDTLSLFGVKSRKRFITSCSASFSLVVAESAYENDESGYLFPKRNISHEKVILIEREHHFFRKDKEQE